MRKVFGSNQEVCHIFASGNYSEGRASGGNVFFENDTLYSYGRHFPIAKRIGGGRYLFTYRVYSMSTSKHLNYARSALRHAELVFCFDPAAPVSENLKLEQSAINAQLAEISTIKYPQGRGLSRVQKCAATIAHIVERAGKYCAAMGAELPDTFKLSGDVLSMAQQFETAKKEAEEKRQAAIKKAEAKEKRKAREYLKAWRNDPTMRTEYMLHRLPVALRIVGDEVQTSHGARITFEEVRASKIWQAVQKVRASGAPVEFDGLHKPTLGNYRADRIEKDGTLKAGCHTIPFAEMETVAAVIYK